MLKSLFAPEGYALIGAAALLALVLSLAGYWFGGVWLLLGATIGLVMLGFTLYFFRDPARTPPEGSAEGNLLLAPADGKIVEIVDEEEPRYIQGRAQRISIFLSPLNVHVNRVPADGIIEYVKYFPGDYLVAWHPKASEKNERSELGMMHPGGEKVVFKQIAGAVARRIVFHLTEGDEVKAGQRFGVVKFGSRMDVLVPPSVQIHAKIGQRVAAGESIIGHFEAAASASTSHADEKVVADG